MYLFNLIFANLQVSPCWAWLCDTQAPCRSRLDPISLSETLQTKHDCTSSGSHSRKVPSIPVGKWTEGGRGHFLPCRTGCLEENEGFQGSVSPHGIDISSAVSSSHPLRSSWQEMGSHIPSYCLEHLQTWVTLVRTPLWIVTLLFLRRGTCSQRLLLGVLCEQTARLNLPKGPGGVLHAPSEPVRCMKNHFSLLWPSEKAICHK